MIDWNKRNGGFLDDFNVMSYQVSNLSQQIDKLKQELQRKDNIINELKESINNFDVFKEFTFPLMKRDEEQQVISSIDYEWRKSIKESFLDKIKELESK